VQFVGGWSVMREWPWNVWLTAACGCVTILLTSVRPICSSPAMADADWYLPITYVIIIILVIRSRNPFSKTWGIVVLATIATWATVPSTSVSWRYRAISYTLLAFALLLSPLQRLFAFKLRDCPLNKHSIDILHQPDNAQFE
jgi:hypothetical protein